MTTVSTVAPLASKCPSCGRSGHWQGGRPALIWIGAIALFPFGLLLLLIKPRWLCTACGHTYRAYETPEGLADETGVVYRILKGLCYVVIGLFCLFAIALGLAFVADALHL